MDKLLEEFIKDWRLKNNSKDAIYSSYHYDAMIEFAKHYHSQQLILSGVRCSDCEIEEIVEQNKDYVLGFYTGDELKEYLSNNYA